MPMSVAALLDGHAAQLEFRRIVEEIFPDAATEILAARRAGERRRGLAAGGIGATLATVLQA